MNTNTTTCQTVGEGYIVVSRASYTAAITICIITSTICLGALIFLLHHVYKQRKSDFEAKKWGRKSAYLRRISLIDKQVKDPPPRYKYTPYFPEYNPPLNTSIRKEYVPPERAYTTKQEYDGKAVNISWDQTRSAWV